MTRFVLIIAAIAVLFLLLLACAANAEDGKTQGTVVVVVMTPIECPPDCEWFEG